MLDIDEDVKTLTAVMLAKDVEPPLAIGLFGDWGHGKSFFMKEIKNEINAVRDEGNDAAYCTNVVQIDFNAWHYVDTNLWASLVSHILSQLSNYVSPKSTPEEQHDKFVDELASTTAIIEEAKVQQTIAKKEMEAKQIELRKLQEEREKKKVELKELSPADIYSVLPDDQKKSIKEVLSRLGLPAAMNSVSDLENAIDDVKTTSGRITSLFFSLLNAKNILIILGFLVLIIVLIPIGIDWFDSWMNVDDKWTTAAAVFAKVTAVITGISVTLNRD